MELIANNQYSFSPLSLPLSLSDLEYSFHSSKEIKIRRISEILKWTISFQLECLSHLIRISFLLYLNLVEESKIIIAVDDDSL